ncbi:hypothetical protein [Rhizobium sp. Leaf383]|uniref:DUF6894 family protein n=1 Tax=Rhizobium sp. Leaf383 TaxID=1736357 RepID=UPI000713C623|nr:hypothetical protein [Rhizobium sp. Leaf383]KQS74510.1 hypothetical protein ASG58_16225 [Rhizobium sp. Leaf383]
MARYFFHVRNGIFAVDQVGLNFETIEDVKMEALRAFSEMINDGEMNSWMGDTWEMVVVDPEGVVQFDLSFTIEGPASKSVTLPGSLRN